MLETLNLFSQTMPTPKKTITEEELDTLLETTEGINQVAMVGSYFILGKGKDIDYLILTDRKQYLIDLLETHEFKYEGIYKGESDFASLRNGEYNLILTESEPFFKEFVLAAKVCRLLQVSDKQKRIEVHSLIMTTRSPPEESPSQFLGFEEEFAGPQPHVVIRDIDVPPRDIQLGENLAEFNLRMAREEEPQHMQQRVVALEERQAAAIARFNANWGWVLADEFQAPRPQQRAAVAHRMIPRAPVVAAEPQRPANPAVAALRRAFRMRY